jgi:hypothetical protein
MWGGEQMESEELIKRINAAVVEVDELHAEAQSLMGCASRCKEDLEDLLSDLEDEQLERK